MYFVDGKTRNSLAKQILQEMALANENLIFSQRDI